MRLVLSVLAIAVCAACYRGPEDIPSEKVAPLVTRQNAGTAVAGVCGDSLYLHLLALPVDSLTARQYEQFRIRDAACVASRAPAQPTPPAPAP
jgi:hypothetical protein